MAFVTDKRNADQCQSGIWEKLPRVSDQSTIDSSDSDIKSENDHQLWITDIGIYSE